MANGGGRGWVSIVVFIGIIVLLNVLSQVFDWGFTFF